MSPNTLSNVISAALPTFAITWLWFWSPIGRLLVPFYKEGDATKVGFTSLNKVWFPYGWISIVSKRFVMPIFTTIYVINLLLIEAVSFPRALNEVRDMYFIMGLWLFVMLTTGSALSLLAMIIVPFSLGYFIGGQTIYGGCVSIAVVVAFAYAYHYYRTYTFRFIISQFQYKNGKYLNGEDINPYWAWLKYYLRRFLPFASAVYLTYSILSNSRPSNFTYINTSTGEIIPILTSLIFYAFFSIDILAGELFIYLQLDLFTSLSNIIHFQKKHPELLAQSDVHPNDEAEEFHPSSPLVSGTDRLPRLDQVSVSGFKMALSFLAIDMFLTIITVSDLPSIPGLTSANIANLSTIIKVPYIVLLLSNGFMRLQDWLGLSKRTGMSSRTVEMDREQRAKHKESLERLLYHILAKQKEQKEYIDVSQNKYLLSLGDSESDRRLYI